MPFFSTVLLAQVLWGLGYTFTSGATQAWIADEIGQERAGEAFLRGSQVGWMGALTAIPISVSLGIVDIRLPIVLGGVLNVLFSGFLVVAMREESFKPKPPEDRTTLSLLLKTVRDTRQLVRRQPTLLALLAIGLFFGLYSEGFDRLWTPHLLESFSQAWTALVNPVIWIGVIEAVALVAGIVATEFTRRRVDTHHAASIARWLILFAAIIVVALAGFGLAKNFWIAVVLYWLIGMARNATSPLQATWLNLRIDDSRVRATVFSVTSQIDAVGQMSGGPLVGAIGNHSIRAALIASSLLLAPVIPLYALAARHGEREASDVG